MVDAPYQLDPFTVVTKINFGGQWFGVFNGPVFGGVNAAFEIDFPQQAGGTPGFIPLQQTIPTIKFDPHLYPIVGSTPYVVKASDLTKSLITNAGGKVTGWGIAPTDDGAGTALMFFKLDSHFPGVPFRVRLRNTGAGVFNGLVFTLQRNWLKAGRPVIGTENLQFAGTLTQNINPGSFLDYIVDPQALTVSAP